MREKKKKNLNYEPVGIVLRRNNEEMVTSNILSTKKKKNLNMFQFEDIVNEVFFYLQHPYR